MKQKVIKLPRTARYVQRIENDGGLSEEQRNLDLRVRQILTEGFVVREVENLEFKDRDRSNRYACRKRKTVKTIVGDSVGSKGRSSSEDSGRLYLPRKKFIVRTTSLDNMKAVVDYFKGTKGRWRARIADTRKKFETIFKDCSTNHSAMNKLKRFKSYVKNHGCRLDKMKKINEMVLERFKEAKEEYKIVQDGDIEDWAREASKTVKLKHFKASQTWSHRFKIDNRIVGRTTRLIVSPRFSTEGSALQNEVNKFFDFADREDRFRPAVVVDADADDDDDEAGFDDETRRIERTSRSKGGDDTRTGGQNGDTSKEEWVTGDSGDMSDDSSD